MYALYHQRRLLAALAGVSKFWFFKKFVQDVVQYQFLVLKAPTLSAPRSLIFFPFYCFFLHISTSRFSNRWKLDNCRCLVFYRARSHSLLHSLTNPASVTIFQSPSLLISDSQQAFVFSESSLISSLQSSFFLLSFTTWLQSSFGLFI